MNKRTSSVSRFGSFITFRRSATSVTWASPAKCDILPGGTSASHRSVGPRVSMSRSSASRSLNFVSDAACATSFNRSNSLRLLIGSTSSSLCSRARSGTVSRPWTIRKNPLFTSVRILAAIASSVV